MAIITQDGLFYGDRVKRLSLMAQLYWPRFFVASNTLGRIELNFEKLTSTAFASLPVKPTHDEFWGFVGEYYTAHLLFTYDSEGQIWGQWDTDPALLPKHKLKQDLRSPEPPKEAWDGWLEQYKKQKHDNRPKVFDVTCFVLPANPSLKVSKDSEILQKVMRGVGVGGGDGKARQGEAKSASSPTDSPLIVSLTLNDGSEFEVRQVLVDEMAQLYPAVPVVQEFRNMRGWLIANKQKRKTRSGILRFANNWLARQQDKGGKVESGNHGGTKTEQRTSKNVAVIGGVLSDLAGRDGRLPQVRSQPDDSEGLVRRPKPLLGSGDP